VLLGDVHPPLEVVASFRDVAEAQEEKEAAINTAEAYQFQKEARTRGEVVRRLRESEGEAREILDKAGSRADAFKSKQAAYAGAPRVTGLRLYLDMVEKVLAGRRKIIVDRAVGGGRRRVFLGSNGFWNNLPLDAGAAEGDSGAQENSDP
jgi:membrane protease subunit HflK